MDTDAPIKDPDGTRPTDIIADGLDRLDDDGLASTVERPAAEDRPRPARLRTHDLPDVRAYIKRHPRGFAVLVLATLAVIMMLALAWRRRGNLPDLDFIEQDARARIEAPAYSGGYFGDDDRLILTQVTVGARQHSERAPEGAELDETFGAMSYVTSDVMLTYQNESVIATKTATLGYAKQNASWIDAGGVNNEQMSFVATRGVSQRKVLLNIEQLLERAGSAVPEQEGHAPLAEFYEDASFEITSASFDDASQTDTLTVHARKGGLFSSYECDIVATFSFGQSNGLWELSECTVTDDAWTRRFDPIVGVWQGTFKSQDVSSGSKCLAAADTPLVLTITSWETSGTGVRITGTISAVAHYHQNPEEDQEATEGDELLADVPFTATLDNSDSAQQSAEAVFTATLSEAVGGKVSITLQFGVGADGAGVTAIVTTEHQFEDTFIVVPYKNQVLYADTYELRLLPEEEPEEDGQNAASDSAQTEPSSEAQPASGGQP